MRNRASWHMTHGQRPRECEVSRYRHGWDPPKPAAPLLDCDAVPSSLCCLSHPQFSLSEATRLLPIFSSMEEIIFSLKHLLAFSGSRTSGITGSLS